MVLVDEPAEQVPPADIKRVGRDRLPGRCERWGEAEGAMGPSAVVVLGLGPQRRIEMPPPWSCPGLVDGSFHATACCERYLLSNSAGDR